ncbi:MAG: NAD(P)/FAD-dependent oxidoreductase [Candidatus Entotheonellia bacterium]
MYDAIVVGGGVVGMSTAYHLLRGGAQTLLIDRADQGRATDAGAGILSPETNSRDPDAWFNFAVEAVAYYPTLVQALQADEGGDTGYAQCGQMIVAISEDEQEAFDRAKRLIFSRQTHRGMPSAEDLHEVSPREAQTQFPPLAPVYGAIYYRRAARVDGRLLNQALRRAAERRGLQIRQGGVERLVIQNHAVTGVIVEGETLPAGKVVIAGGAWSQAFGVQLGVEIPITPQRGQIIHLGLSPTDTSAWPMISAFHGHYMVPWPDHRVVVGATRETGSGFRPYTTAAGVREVLSEALRVAPGLAAAEIRDIRVGLRPYSADTMPVLGPVPGVREIALATGHGPTGLTLGPYSGKVVADMVLGTQPTVDISAFYVTRFAADATTTRAPVIHA